ncbi:MAG: ABC exporter membrane fusion protein [Oscillatoriophycideae cyanobacterium NC_groundwater_1537_Pr4_S-0.65um_50_18]|nr:ABC exporter membrane fusion protein [Oscillatoriophycideae cyanobacterium NC_groundwater_1537_Pr4_S-0.65um_50_18]
MQPANPEASLVRRLLPRSPQQWILTAALGGAIAITAFYTTSPSQPAPGSAAPIAAPAANAVTALGRLEPKGEVINLAVSSGSRIAQLLVQQGDLVKTGQVIAILDSRDRLEAALLKAQEQVRVAQSQLAQVEAGAKAGEIDAQAATVDRLKAELDNAQTEYQRYQKLYQEGAIAISALDSKRLVAETAAAQVQQAQQTLQSIAEVRPVDIQAAQAQVNDALAAVQQAQAELDLAYVRSPRNGQILKIHTWAGEIVGSDGIVELGQTEQMYAVAEVYESDVQRVQIGQPATITSSAFTGEAQGTVEQIGLQIRKNDVLDTDPTAAADARVIEVKIRLNPASTRKVANFTNLEVTVAIATPSR